MLKEHRLILVAYLRDFVFLHTMPQRPKIRGLLGDLLIHSKLQNSDTGRLEEKPDAVNAWI